MQFHAPLIPGKLIQRYKRFLADVELADGSVITAHVANPGSMLGMKDPGMTVWLSPAANPKRKLKFSWELAEVDGTLINVNTGHPNKIGEEGIKAGLIPELDGYDQLKREVKYGENSRIDILLSNEDDAKLCYVEIKSVTLRRKDNAEFPDSVTARGAKHLAELSNMVAQGHRAVMLYLVQRQDCTSFSIAADLDPNYAEALQQAMAMGVEVLCYTCAVTTDGICVAKPLKIAI
ncbi:MAG: DNA/RNA nuclease SfsA [Alphaproteobacteria bacterium]|nr:MAG: DNA/RNA nuclease SfsA [Alphaproteobacteria bacterium]